jgi:hypothetical protein
VLVVDAPRCRIAPTPPTLHVVLADAVIVSVFWLPAVVEKIIPVDPALTVAPVMYTRFGVASAPIDPSTSMFVVPAVTVDDVITATRFPDPPST